MKNKKKLSRKNLVLLIIGGVAVVSIIVTVILLNTVFAPNASAKNATNRAFDAIYDCQFEDFVEATIYNPDCMLALGLNLSGELNNQVQPYFEEAKAVLRENSMTYRRKSTKVSEFSPGEDGFKKCIDLLRTEYFDVYDGKIEKVAYAEIEFECTYRDENGKKQTERDNDVSWSLCIDGKWYVIPNVSESLD